MSETFRRPAEAFMTTRWSVVLAAGGADQARRTAALEELSETYWYPLYSYLRRSGHGADDAADAVQRLFLSLLSRPELDRVDPARGRFRSWLLTALKHDVINHRERERAVRRGGGRTLLSFDADRADARYASEPADRRTPEQAFERAWAQAVLARALERLEEEQNRIGRKAHFDALLPALTAREDALAHSQVAEQLGVSEVSIKVALHRMRKRLGELVRDEVAATLSDPGELDHEVRLLFEALAAP